MSTTGGPQAPSDGWQTRWLIQAGALLLQNPMTVLVGAFGIALFAILEDITSSLFSGLWGYVFATSITSSLGILVPISICASLAISEKHGTTSKSDMISGIKSILIVLFLINSVIISMAALMIVSEVNMAGSISQPPRSDADLFLSGAVPAVAGSLFAALPVNALWVALVTQMAMSFSEMRMTGFMLIKRSFHAWAAIILVTMVLAQFTLVMPALVGAALLIFLSAWLYVAAREIFGGISSNTYSMEARASAMEA